MENNKKQLLYILIVVGVILIFGIGILIGLSINKNNNSTLTEIRYDDNNSINKQTISEEPIKENEIIDNSIPNESKDITSNNTIIESKNIETNTEVEEKQEIANTEEQPNETIQELSSNDTTIVNTLNDTLDTINNAKINESFKEKAKSTFISLVDFIFYDGEIKGVTFKELTNAGKNKVIELAEMIDQKLEEKVPGYKNSISSVYGKTLNKIKDMFKNDTDNLDELLKKTLDIDDYYSIINAKDEMKQKLSNAKTFITEKGSNIISSVKEKLSSWYENFKNN